MGIKFYLGLLLLGAILIAVSARRQRFDGDPCTGSWRGLGAYCSWQKGKYVYEDVVDKACIENLTWEYDIEGVMQSYTFCIREGFSFNSKAECENKCITNYG